MGWMGGQRRAGRVGVERLENNAHLDGNNESWDEEATRKLPDRLGTTHFARMCSATTMTNANTNTRIAKHKH